MPEPFRSELARFIRGVDFWNTMASWPLALRIDAYVEERLNPSLGYLSIANYVHTINPHKTYNAAQLADAIVDRFELDEEN